MTGPKPDPSDVETRPISVAELLAKNGSIGSPPVTGRRRRRRGNADAVTVAELTGEIPVIRDEDFPPEQQDTPGESAGSADRADGSDAPDVSGVSSGASDGPDSPEASDSPDSPDSPDSAGVSDSSDSAGVSDSSGTGDSADASDSSGSSVTPDSDASGRLPIGPAPGFVAEDRPATGPRPAERPKRPAPEPRWPKSPPQPARASGPQPSPYPRPMRRSDPPAEANGRPAAREATGSDAERMRPDPVDSYTDFEVDVMDTDVRDADLSVGDSAYVRSYLSNAGAAERSGRPVPGSDLDAGAAEPGDADDFAGTDDSAGQEQADAYVGRPGVVGGALAVLQSILAVAFGGGLFIAFDQLWRWNSIVALVLTVLVTLGLVAAVQAVRKTVDIVSTLIAVAVGLLVTLGPLALHAG